MTNSSNAIDDRSESAKGLAISSADGIQLGHRSVYETERINITLRWARNGVHMCVLCAAEYCRNRLDTAWYLMGSINISNACSCMCTDLVSSSSTSLTRGSSGTGGSGRFGYDDTVVFKVNRHGLGAVCRMQTL